MCVLDPTASDWGVETGGLVRRLQRIPESGQWQWGRMKEGVSIHLGSRSGGLGDRLAGSPRHKVDLGSWRTGGGAVS